jgi:rhodanese-related sulfurtransferase
MASEQRTIEPEEVREMLAANEATALDIRDDEAWKSGHLPGARHVDESEVEAAIDDADTDHTVVIVCEDGEASAELASGLDGSDREIATLKGGMSAWRSDDQPMQPSYDPDDDVPI